MADFAVLARLCKRHLRWKHEQTLNMCEHMWLYWQSAQFFFFQFHSQNYLPPFFLVNTILTQVIQLPRSSKTILLANLLLKNMNQKVYMSKKSNTQWRAIVAYDAVNKSKFMAEWHIWSFCSSERRNSLVPTTNFYSHNCHLHPN